MLVAALSSPPTSSISSAISCARAPARALEGHVLEKMRDAVLVAPARGARPAATHTPSDDRLADAACAAMTTCRPFARRVDFDAHRSASPHDAPCSPIEGARRRRDRLAYGMRSEVRRSRARRGGRPAARPDRACHGVRELGRMRGGQHHHAARPGRATLASPRDDAAGGMRISR